MHGVLQGAPTYLLHERLGSGGMGVVYRGTIVTPAGERQVAIKRLLARGQGGEQATERLVAEARLVFQLTHANICQVLDLGMNEEGTFIVLEYTRGLDLRALLERLSKKGKALAIPSAMYLVREVARALDYAHRRTNAHGQSLGLVHGDVTPGNILLSIEGEVKLTDFGIARALLTAAPGSHFLGGTPGFVPPEASASLDHRADIYALGVTLYVALFGRVRGSITVDPAALRARRPEVSPELCAIIKRATAPAPADRFLSADELERVLSLEMARRYPAFTPATLAASVRDHVGGPGPWHSWQKHGGTLVSLTGTDGQTSARPGAIPGRDSSGGESVVRELPRGTVLLQRGLGRAEGRPRVRRVGMAALGALALASAIALFARSARTTAALPMLLPIPGPAPAAQNVRPEESPTEPLFETQHKSGRTGSSEAPLELPAPPAPTAERPPSHATKRPPKPVKAFVTVNSVDWGAVFIDGHRVADETPLYRHALSTGRHQVQVFYPYRRAFSEKRTIALQPGEEMVVGFR